VGGSLPAHVGADGGGRCRAGCCRGSGTRYEGITPAAGDLLRSVDAGGVPAFVTGNLRQIASDNGIEVGPGWTPNEIVDAIRAKVRDAEPEGPAPGL
jgi:hypothetical protein